MNVLIVVGSRFGNTRRVADAMAAAMAPDHTVRVMDERAAEDEYGLEVDVLVVGAPTQMHGLRIIGRRFLDDLPRRAFEGVAAAAFDTRLPGPVGRTGSAATRIARRLESAGCRLVIPPESFLVQGFEGPLTEGEEARAGTWAQAVLAASAPMAV